MAIKIFHDKNEKVACDIITIYELKSYLIRSY